MYTGESDAFWDIWRQLYSPAKAEFDRALKAAEDRADRKERETGQRPDPMNSSNVKEARAKKYLAEQAMALVMTERRSQRYGSVGYDAVRVHTEEWSTLLEAMAALWNFRRVNDAEPSREERAARVDEAFAAVLRDEVSEQALVKQHRARVLAGEEEPTADDAEWLTEHARKAAAEAQTLAEAAKAAEERSRALAAAAKGK